MFFFVGLLYFCGNRFLLDFLCLFTFLADLYCNYNDTCKLFIAGFRVRAAGKRRVVMIIFRWSLSVLF